MRTKTNKSYECIKILQLVLVRMRTLQYLFTSTYLRAFVF